MRPVQSGTLAPIPAQTRYLTFRLAVGSDARGTHFRCSQPLSVTHT
jgi:hypothetical protein